MQLKIIKLVQLLKEKTKLSSVYFNYVLVQFDLNKLLQ